MALATIILMTRIWGMGQSFSVYEHPFFSHSSPTLVVAAKDLPEAESIIKAQSDSVLWLDVRFSKDKEVFVLSASEDTRFLKDRRSQQEAQPQTAIYTSGRLAEYNWEDIHGFFPQTVLLNEFYKTFPNTRFILNVIDNVSDAHTTLVNHLEKSKPNERTLVQSEALILMTAIKDLKPEWLYGTSKPDIMRFLSFDAMWILPAVQFKGDVAIFPFKVSNRPAFNIEILQEMKRRHKKILLGPLQSQEELQAAEELSVDGFIFRNLEEFQLWLGQSPAK